MEETEGDILVITETALVYQYQALFPEGMHLQFCGLDDAAGLLEHRSFDLALLDSGRETAKGLQILRQIKSASPEIPVLFIAERGSVTSVKEAYHAGARDFLEKPLNVAELRKTVGNLLAFKKACKEKRLPFLSEPESAFYGFPSDLTDKPAYIIRAIRYIESNLSSKISLGEIAREANFSKYHFCRIFARYTGMTPFQFASVMRIEKAKRLLSNEDVTISEIAAQVGFSDLGTFLRQFKKITGFTPTRYRNWTKQSKAGDRVRTAATQPV